MRTRDKGKERRLHQPGIICIRHMGLLGAKEVMGS